ncbi:hypothetical protein J6590_020178, partial [Homalodisca vitripennis]
NNARNLQNHVSTETPRGILVWDMQDILAYSLQKVSLHIDVKLLTYTDTDAHINKSGLVLPTAEAPLGILESRI